jgi:hypothetical protein
MAGVRGFSERSATALLGTVSFLIGLASKIER